MVMQWDEIPRAAVACEDAHEHIIKLCYASLLESGHCHRPEYLSLACGEIRKPSLFL
jgi:hypothetical protein